MYNLCMGDTRRGHRDMWPIPGGEARVMSQRGRAGDGGRHDVG